MRNTTTIRYAIATVALMLGFAFSIRLSERGFLFESATTDAMASTATAEETYDLESLTILNRVLLQLKDNYVEPERIDANRMLVRALDRVQTTVPELVAVFDAPMDQSPSQVEIRVGAESQVFDLPEMESLWQMRMKLQDIFRFVQESTDPSEVELQRVEYAAINGMLSTLDPHSVLLDPEVYSDMQTQNQGHFGGLGIVISIRDSQLTVISPIDDTPASRAGFRAGDRIVKINDESTVNMPLDEAVNRLRGVPGTEVTVEVMRDGWTEPHAFNLRREVINIESVNHEALGDGVGYIEIRNFQANTHDDLMQALAELEEEMGPLRGLVLDLRNNPGGLLAQAIAVSDTFLSEGTIVTTVGIGDRLREENAATRDGTQEDYPIAVLVNPGSASASEIVAGALKNHGRAVIIGDTTFGKGSVQVIYPFADGSALKLTIAKYLTPGDVSIQGVGIVPDIRTVPVTIDDEFINLYPSTHITREGDLNEALGSENLRDEHERPSEVVSYYYEPEEIDPEAIRDPDEFVMDFEIDFARQVLLASGDETERTTMLARASDAIDSVRAEQLVEVQERLRNRNVDWTTGANVIQPITVDVTTAPAAGRVHVGDPISFNVSVTNDGTRPLHQVRAVSTSDYALFDDHEFVFGRVDPGQTASWTVSIDVPIEDPSRLERVAFDVFADMIDLDAHGETFVEVVGQSRPAWGFSYFLDDSAGNGDGLLQVGETVHFVMDVTNTGAGAAEESVMYLRNQSDAAIFLNQGRESIETLASGESHRADFEFEVRARPEEGTVTLETVVYDSVFREILSEELVIPVSETAPQVEVRSGRAMVPDGASLPIRIGASEASPVFATLDGGGSLPVTAYVDGWVRVEWDGGRGWVPENAVEVADPVAVPPSEVRTLIPFQPPSIALEGDTVRTDSETFNLRGSISDDSQVRDFYVVIQNRIGEYQFQQLKVDYQYLGVPSATINEEVPLRPGANRITVFARDDDKIESSETLFVYRDE